MKMKLCSQCQRDRPARQVHRNRKTGKNICRCCASSNKAWEKRRCFRCGNDKRGNLIHIDRHTGEAVCRSCQRKTRPKVPRPYKGRSKPTPQQRERWRKAYENRHRDTPGARRNHGQVWTGRDLARITDPKRPSDLELALELGRTPHAISNMRYLLRQEERTKEKKSARG